MAPLSSKSRTRLLKHAHMMHWAQGSVAILSVLDRRGSSIIAVVHSKSYPSNYLCSQKGKHNRLHLFLDPYTALCRGSPFL